MERFETYPNNRQENWITYRESPEFLSGIKKLEKLYEITHQAKVIILAVALNIKKAGEFEVSESEANYTEEMLSELGVFFNRHSTHEEHGLIETRFFIGATMEDLHEALDATGKGDHASFGKAMDFPVTAVEAYANESKLVQWGDWSRLTEEEKAFLFFRFSEEHFDEEVKWLEQIIAAVKRYSPTIYEEVMKMR